MYTLWILTKSAVKMFVRNKQALFFTFFFPVFLMVVLGLINFDRPRNIDVGLILTGPPNQATQQFFDGLKQVPLFTIHEGIESSEREALADDKRAVVFIIPHDLIPGPAKITALTNSSQAQNAAAAINIVSGILDKAALRLSGGSNLFSLQTEEINTHHLRYFDFLLPGLIAFSIMQMSIFSVGFVFVMYKEKGILKRLLATPMLPSSFVLSNVVTRLIVTLIQATTFIVIGVLVFKAQVIGSYWLLFLIALFGSLMFLGLGFLISGMASTVESVPALANLFAFPMMFLGGVFFPIESFPTWLQKIAEYLPLTFFADALRQVMTRGATIGDISRDIWWMAFWAGILVVLANFTFSLEEKKQ